MKYLKIAGSVFTAIGIGLFNVLVYVVICALMFSLVAVPVWLISLIPGVSSASFAFWIIGAAAVIFAIAAVVWVVHTAHTVRKRGVKGAFKRRNLFHEEMGY